MHGYIGPFLGQNRLHLPHKELVYAASNSDLVFIGTSLRLDTSLHNPVTGKGYYSADIKAEKVLKGHSQQTAISLKWHPMTTGYKVGSRHVFFVKLRQETPLVLKELYLFEPHIPLARIYGAMDGGRDVTLEAISFLCGLSSKLPDNFSSSLLLEIKEPGWSRQNTAILLAYELSQAACLPALIFAIKSKTDKKPLAIYSACLLDGQSGASAALWSFDNQPSPIPYKTHMMFDAIAAAGSLASIGPLREFGDNNPDQRVSCAFAIRAISADLAPPIIRAWLADQKHKNMVELVREPFEKSRAVILSTDQLLRAALEGRAPLSELSNRH